MSSLLSKISVGSGSTRHQSLVPVQFRLSSDIDLVEFRYSSDQVLVQLRFSYGPVPVHFQLGSGTVAFLFGSSSRRVPVQFRLTISSCIDPVEVELRFSFGLVPSQPWYVVPVQVRSSSSPDPPRFRPRSGSVRNQFLFLVQLQFVGGPVLLPVQVPVLVL